MKMQRKFSMRAIILIVLNVLLIVALVFVFWLYKTEYEKKLYNQNLNDIANINQAASTISSEMFSHMERKLSDVEKYLRRHPMKLKQLLTFIEETNQGSNRSYQLVDAKGNGYLVSASSQGVYHKLNYSDASYKNLRFIFESASEKDMGVLFSNEFTDQVTASRSFAQYTSVPCLDENGKKEYYTLMSVSQTTEFLKNIDIDGGFDNMTTVLINRDGGYIIRDSDLLSSDFFQYLANYNDMSLDDCNQLKDEINAKRDSYFIKKDQTQEDNVFSYTKITDTEWFCVSKVPVASFHMAGLDITFAVVMFLVLLGIMGVNISWMAQMNIRMKRSMQEAQNASKAKTDFLSRMSHDIRTPINVISGMTELAEMEDNPTQTAEYLLNIRSSGKYLLGLVNDILDMNKVESGKMELHNKPYSFAEFISYLELVIHPLAEKKNQTIHFEGNRKAKSFMVDSLRLNQIFFNLLSNAVKYTPENGHITMRANQRILDSTTVALDFAVQDDGVGMSEEFQKNMFNAFTQENRVDGAVAPGSGLGLSIVNKLVELMQGTLRVESKVGVGTTFYLHFELPVVAERREPEYKEEKIVALEGKHILLCEDHPLNAMIIVKLLEKKGVTVDVAEDGQRGLEQFIAHEAAYYDLILMDVRMPVKDGLETTREIRAMEREDADEIPIIALTANAYDVDVQNCIEAGMNAHLAKPIEPEVLYQKISRYIK